MSIEGAVETEVFDAYVERVLRPTLRAGRGRVQGSGHLVVAVFADRDDVFKDGGRDASG